MAQQEPQRGYLVELEEKVRRLTQLRVEAMGAPPSTKGCVVLARRWVVEGSFGWLSKYRRVTGPDYETNPRISEAISKACFCHLMLRLLANLAPPEHSP